MPSSRIAPQTFDLVVVSNRLPVDRVAGSAGQTDQWRRSPGGLVTALHPLMQRNGGAWVGWHGAPDERLEDFDHDGMRLVPVALSAAEVSTYYEGFSNATLWPLFHDVIAPPEYHRTWWEAYREVNQRFARECARVAAQNATVWVQDYQLLLVPALLRQLRPDLKIGFFLHIPFPPAELFAQLPWRREALEGMLGASLLGFQRQTDTANFLRCVRRFAQRPVKNKRIEIEMSNGRTRRVEADTFPISIDADVITRLANDPKVIERAKRIRESLGGARKVVLGVDRLDYTKGIRHRIKAYGELLNDGKVKVEDAALIQVASPSRERVSSYVQLREDVELAVGRINGNFDTLEHTAIRYLHHSYPMEEMVALYLAADVMLVTALRDGMNLVAKEYVAARQDDSGALVLSEFAGAADELGAAILTNPHDIGGMKDDIVRALTMSADESQRRMKRLRRQVLANDIDRWSSDFLERLESTTPADGSSPEDELEPSGEPARAVVANADETHGLPLADRLREETLRRLTEAERLLVALDFDGVVAPIVARAEDARPLPKTKEVLDALAEVEGVQVAFVSGRSLASLRACADPHRNVALIGSHGAEQHLPGSDQGSGLTLTDEQEQTLAKAERVLKSVARKHNGAWVEIKPAGVVLHVRQVPQDMQEHASVEAMQRVYVEVPKAHVSRGKSVVEIAVLKAHKGEGIEYLREAYNPSSTLFMGDDVTDENAFAVLEQGEGEPDVGVKVGPGATAAAARLNDPEEVAAFLEEVLRARRDGRKG
ncbi:bifunctional alpha,alpha-trehalose-phosphate synthase (UDP-forming)/trehalose-phosphatase [Arthrobacter sp. UM1]|uniref:bifunctional alpha,alpha-trehalose-phosphate synthase (UDP-forming)/trehalose-phosphatase n=1 Tax=Arthrobacter sp. UM1 TaxID=2766776 RepID=UPI001CF7009F|nr:bifunctional alpha,alpha-trehalose-phosphate synthase (UDP-forming)/trehalose-phosphatase [Arthrobacter sp. UM1]MCB4207824.1 bifunctional alpha,alpha-trehalose-phosphate synthase (UDP-forming)/trehalose-phosphatase [Arthrobacter sp. UM1]